jgi:adenylate kinase family enzyme
MKKVTLLYVHPLLSSSFIATVLCERYHIEELRIRDLFRDMLKAGGELAEQINQIMAQGQLIPTNIIEKIIGQRFHALAGDILFYGYPRTIEQFKSFEKFCEKENFLIERLWYVGVSNSVSIPDALAKKKNEWHEKYGDEAERNLQQKHDELTKTIEQLTVYRTSSWRVVLLDEDEITDLTRIRKRINEIVA